MAIATQVSRAIAVWVLVIFFAMQVPTFASFDSALRAYKSRRYQDSITGFQQVLSQSPRQVRAWFYLGLASAKQGQLPAAAKAFDKVIQLSPSQSDMAKKARTNLEAIKREQVKLANKQFNRQHSAKLERTLDKAHKANKYRNDNYLNHVIRNGHVVHWDLANMPLRVYIDTKQKVKGFRPGMKRLVSQAMAQWKSASYGKIRFVETKNPARADIRVHWTERLENNRVGVSPFRAQGNRIVQSDVIIATHDPLGNPLATAQLAQVTLHEFGHALGFQGHSPFPEDVMFFSSNPGQVARLTQRDKKTFRMLYSLDAHITR